MSYLGYTIEEIDKLLSYDKDTGRFISKTSNKEIVDRYYSYRNPRTKKVVCFNLTRVAILLTTKEPLKDEDKVICIDGDKYNLKYDNLSVVRHKDIFPPRNSEKNEYIETDEDYIFYGTMNRLFVVRRGPTQSVYRTYSKEKAIEVRDRWLQSNKELNEWDETMPLMFRS